MKQTKWYTTRVGFRKKVKGKQPRTINVYLTKKSIPKVYFGKDFTIVKTTSTIRGKPIRKHIAYVVYRNP